MPDPLPPLSWDLWREHILPFLTESFFGVSRKSAHFDEIAGLDRVQGRVYFNLNAMVAVPLLGPLVGKVLGKVDARAGVVVGELIEAGVLTPRRLSGSPATRGLFHIGTALRGLPRSLRVLWPIQCRRNLEAAAREVCARPPVDEISNDELLEELGLWSSPSAGAMREGMDMLTGALITFMQAERPFEP
ncbi:MAG: hypothetical protein VYE73_09830 [Acidobacteriota bacterium]|nr:hypothetical protein [Acidobacteriota bacterium]